MPSFSFINTSYFLLTPLILLPVLIHLISQKNRKNLDYPTLKFIRAAYLKKAKRLKINEILLLIVRTLITALLILAFARLLMFLPDHAPAAGQKYAVIIDNSYSSAYTDISNQPDKYFDKVKSKAAEIISGAQNRPLFAICTASAPDGDSGFIEQAAALEYIKNINYTYRTFSLAGAVSALSKKDYYKDLAGVYAVSDFISSDRGQEAKLNACIENNPAIKQGPRFTLINCGPSDIIEARGNKNLSIISARVSDERVTAGKPLQIICKIKNHSLHSISSEVTLLSDGIKLAAASFGAGPGEICDAHINHVFMNSGDYALKLSLADDALAFDNAYNMVISPVSSLYVLILCQHDPADRDNYIYKYVSAALNPLNSISIKDGLIIQPLIVNLANNPPIDFKNFDAVIISGVKDASADLSMKLEKYINDGGGVLFLPPEAPYLNSFSKFFSRLLPIDIGGATPVSSPDDKNYFNLCNINYDHEIFNIYKNKNSGDIGRPKFYKIIPCGRRDKIAPEVSIIADFENGIPAVAEKKIGRGISMIFAGYLDPAGSDISNSPLFVPFIHQIAYYINKNRRTGARSYTIGETIRQTYSVNERISGVSTLKPDSQIESRLDIKTSAGGLYSEITDTFTPGFYTLFKKSDDKISKKLFAVNCDARESELVSSDYEAAGAVLSRHWLLSNGEAGPRGVKSEKRTEITPYLFLLILILMAVESYLTYLIRQ